MPAEPCCYRRGFLPLDVSERLCRELLETVCWREEWLHLYGRRVRVPRLIAWYGDPGLNYRYAGRDHHTTGWPARLAEVRDRLTAVLGPTFNFVLVNRYRDGDDHMGWHTDDSGAMATGWRRSAWAPPGGSSCGPAAKPGPGGTISRPARCWCWTGAVRTVCPPPADRSGSGST